MQSVATYPKAYAAKLKLTTTHCQQTCVDGTRTSSIPMVAERDWSAPFMGILDLLPHQLPPWMALILIYGQRASRIACMPFDLLQLPILRPTCPNSWEWKILLLTMVCVVQLMNPIFLLLLRNYYLSLHVAQGILNSTK